MSSMISVFICDDHTMVRQGLRRVLSELADVTVVGEAYTAIGIEDTVRQLAPDVVLLDITLPGRSGLEAARALKGMEKPPFVLFLTMHDHPQYVAESVRAGADGYALKSCEPDELELAIRQVASGARAFEQVASQLSSALGSGSGSPTLDELSEREREILALVASGLSSKQIGDQLGISFRTVERHRDSIMRKLKIRSVAELTLFSVRAGLIE